MNAELKSLMAHGIKRNETRPRRTHIRERIAITAAKRRPKADNIDFELKEVLWSYAEVLTGRKRFALVQELLDELPRGAVVCTLEIYDCVETEKFINAIGNVSEMSRLNVTPLEITCGNYSPGRFAYLTRKVHLIKKPIPITGHQGWMNIAPEIVSEIERHTA